jgi:formate hydrogenlyase subunit 6/NADH:ubiquinone oxidoreductase subunit I
MNLAFRDGKFDVVVAAGPRVETWPSAGVRSLSVLCAEMGLSVGQFGGDALTVRGVIPLPGTGGLVLIEDIQKRIHRIHARAIVRVLPDSTLPDPFPGWRSQGLLPLATAERLRRESQILWDPITAILGTGNRALRFGTTLLESGVPQVVCIETHSQWSAKRFAGWEVERRRFEMAGGKITEAKPLQLIPKGPLLWQLRLQDSHGIRVLDVGRVVSAGPFRNLQGVREHPPGSFLYELDQTAATTHAEDVEGWVLEEERGNWLAGKIVKALTSDLGHKREDLDRVFRRARGRLKRYLRHREEPFTPSYQGKWISVSESKFIRSFSGVPQQAQLSRPIASVECFEEIPCNICQKACPTSAIQIGKVPRNKYPILNESACIGCGLCVSACPTGTISMIQENESQSTSQLTLPWRGNKTWSPGESATLLNRRGESLGSARVLGPGGPEIGGEAAAFPEGSADLIPKIDPLPKGERNDKVQLVRVDLPTHLIWEARGIKKGRPPASSDEAYLASVDRASAAGEKVEITLNG